MRVSVLSVVCATLLWCGPASAASVVQDTGYGSQRTPATIALYDPSLGPLESVGVQGTISLSYQLIVRNDPFNLPELTIPHTAQGALTLTDEFGLPIGSPFVTATLAGYETYAEGSLFGSMYLTANVFEILTGDEVDQFIAGTLTTAQIWPVASMFYVFPEAGVRYATPGDVGSYSLRITYNVPEPATWAMMLLGFAAIGFAVRNSKANQLRLSSQRDS